MAETYESLIGSQLVIGFPGTTLTSDIVRQFKETHAGGVIFYRINFESPEQLRKLITDLENALERRLLVTVDHEGGRVIMYRDGVTIFPDNLAIGRTRNVEYVRKQGEITARELRALGTDINFAPTVDVLTGDFSPNIGIRAYGGDWKMVSDMGVAYVTALQKGGVSATVKHFPGQGHSPMDAHLGLPTLNSTWEEMEKIHLRPFVAAIQAGVEVVMSSHPRYPRLDPNPNNIATFSRRIVRDYLRDELKFKGLIASDDLEMGAVRDIAPIDVAGVRTAAAGHDLILSCHDFVSQRKIFGALLDAYKNKTLPLGELEESVDRIRRHPFNKRARFSGNIGPDPEGPPLAQKICREAVEVTQDPEGMIPLPASLRSDIGVIFPKLSSFAQKIMIERPFEDEATYLHKTLGGFKGAHAVEIYDVEPKPEDVDRAVNLAGRSTVTIYFSFDARLFPAQQKLLSAVQTASRKLIVVFLRDPYDKSFLAPQNSGVTCFGFRQCQIDAVIERIFGERR